MKFGETIKQIRTDKNLTQTQLSEGILARNHLSQVENNNYFPSYDKFFSLLDRLNVTFEEFLFIQNDKKVHFKQRIRSQIAEAANLNDIKKLEDLAVAARDLHEQTKNITYYHYMLISKALVTYNIDHTVSDDMVKFVTPIKEYLLGMDNWYLYELRLFSNIIFALTVDEALLFSRRALKRLDNFRYFTEYQHTEQHIYHNLSRLCLEFEDFGNAKMFAKKAIDIANKYTLVYEKVCSEMNLAIALIKLGQDAYEIIKKKMLIIDYLEFDNLYEHYMIVLKKFNIDVKLLKA
ncbi:helix-turn-helix domain-containing protein [Listeria booriae]|uniref:Helix-turn-helix domain-containing protein n=1 Tax=Listeria booriae TaxID=1552123 RepID=A0A7X1A8M9_9LIST|nr:Rgg/GadR/MutR family transcriptional regulator [Listeria booriae]MBC1231024.1 helix-turn-helix domain-containing protein [Listeria booriae]MBC2373292.1 helix-turn-helix domain-containing protein [Listeria booriae]MBC2391582.1 helix-turn-helix domain-containing protein [Listeria booriae]